MDHKSAKSRPATYPLVVIPLRFFPTGGESKAPVKTSIGVSLVLFSMLGLQLTGCTWLEKSGSGDSNQGIKAMSDPTVVPAGVNGGHQADSNGTLRNDLIVGEQFPSQFASSPDRSIQVRHGFFPTVIVVIPPRSDG